MMIVTVLALRERLTMRGLRRVAVCYDLAIFTIR